MPKHYWERTTFRGIHSQQAKVEHGQAYAADLLNLRIDGDGWLRTRPPADAIGTDGLPITGLAATDDFLWVLRTDGQLYVRPRPFDSEIAVPGVLPTLPTAPPTPQPEPEPPPVGDPEVIPPEPEPEPEPPEPTVPLTDVGDGSIPDPDYYDRRFRPNEFIGVRFPLTPEAPDPTPTVTVSFDNPEWRSATIYVNAGDLVVTAVSPGADSPDYGPFGDGESAAGEMRVVISQTGGQTFVRGVYALSAVGPNVVIPPSL